MAQETYEVVLTLYMLVLSADSFGKQFEPQTRSNLQASLLSSNNFFLASSNFCSLLIIIPSSLEQDQTQQNVRPDLDRNCCATMKYFLEVLILKKISR